MVIPPGDIVSSGKPAAFPRQAAVYRKYLGLQAVAPQPKYSSLGGQLVLSAGFGLEGTGLALASAIAGAAYLGIEVDPQPLKAAVRNGSCDFMVNTLDEALRVLKNELRKRKPLSVGLLGDASQLLPAMVERGVQPDLLSDTSPLGDPDRYVFSGHAAGVEAAMAAHRLALRQFVERGAKIVNSSAALQWALGSALSRDAGTPELAAVPGAIEVVWTAGNLRDLQRMDRAALEQLPAEDSVRRRWLEQAAGFFHRQIPLERVLQVAPEELPRLLDAFQRTVSLEAPTGVRWQNSAGEPQSIALGPRTADVGGG